jgi:hypothetical protein
MYRCIWNFAHMFKKTSANLQAFIWPMESISVRSDRYVWRWNRKNTKLLCLKNRNKKNAWFHATLNFTTAILIEQTLSTFGSIKLEKKKSLSLSKPQKAMFLDYAINSWLKKSCKSSMNPTHRSLLKSLRWDFHELYFELIPTESADKERNSTWRVAYKSS